MAYCYFLVEQQLLVLVCFSILKAYDWLEPLLKLCNLEGCITSLILCKHLDFLRTFQSIRFLHLTTPYLFMGFPSLKLRESCLLEVVFS